MKQFCTIALFLVSLNSYSQSKQLYNQIFTDSIISVALESIKENVPKTYYLLSHSSQWANSRFYYHPPGPGQYPEGMNLYAYNDSFITKNITPKEWSYIAHTALRTTAKTIKKQSSNIILINDPAKSKDSVFFEVTRPVTNKRYIMVDLTYYLKAPPTTQDRFLDQWYRGQALLVFSNESKTKWKILRIVNRFIL